MIKREILEKAIEKSGLDCQVSGAEGCNVKVFDGGDDAVKIMTPFEFIFSHYFAKAFYGSRRVGVTREDIFGDGINAHEIIGYAEMWEICLLKAVRKENPLDYIRQFVEECK